MRHPSTRAERRHARTLSKLRYQRFLQLIHSYQSTQEAAEMNRLWNHGGKRCEAHGNRCAHSLIERYEARREIKRLRRFSITLTASCRHESPQIRESVG